MKKWMVLTLVLCVYLVAGCGGGSVSGPSGGAAKLPQIGQWTNNAEFGAIYQLEIKPSGENFLVTAYHKNFPGVKTVDYIAKKSGNNLAVDAGGTSLAVVHDPGSDTLSFDGGKYRRQTADDAKKLEELKKQK